MMIFPITACFPKPEPAGALRRLKPFLSASSGSVCKLACRDRGIKAHFSSLEQAQKGTGTKKGIFAKEAFTYNAETDTFTCPAGQTLKRRKFFKKRQHYEYIASAKICNNCQLRGQCTKAKTGRTLKRHLRQNDLDHMVKKANSPGKWLGGRAYG